MIKLNLHNSGRIKVIIYFLRKEAFFFSNVSLSMEANLQKKKKKIVTRFFISYFLKRKLVKSIGPCNEPYCQCGLDFKVSDLFTF